MGQFCQYAGRASPQGSEYKIHGTVQKLRNSLPGERFVGRTTPNYRQKAAGKVAAFKEWENFWNKQTAKQSTNHQATADPEIWIAANSFIDEKTGETRMNFWGTPISIHKNLNRAQSSIPIQMRSEHIGFNSYLHRRNVTGANSPRCQCRYPSQNVKHMIMACFNWVKGRGEILRKSEPRSLEAMMNNPKYIARMTRWIQQEGRLEQFRLTLEVEATMR